MLCALRYLDSMSIVRLLPPNEGFSESFQCLSKRRALAFSPTSPCGVVVGRLRCRRVQLQFTGSSPLTRLSRILFLREPFVRFLSCLGEEWTFKRISSSNKRRHTTQIPATTSGHPLSHTHTQCRRPSNPWNRKWKFCTPSVIQ